MITSNSSVNYIKHLTEVFSRFSSEDKLSAYHISLYVSLFQIWNMNRFQNPFNVYRSEIMLLSRIGSRSTYHRCICDLEKMGYLNYFPSKNAFVGSKIEIISFDNYTHLSSTDMGHLKEPSSPIRSTDLGLPCPTEGHQKEPIYKHIKHNKHINLTIEQDEFCQVEKSPKKKAKNSSFEVPILENVVEYFKTKKQSEIEAQKFFNYFESNGWKVGGRTPMKNWQASANNWILNSSKYQPTLFQPKTDNLHTNQNKDYSIPL